MPRTRPTRAPVRDNRSFRSQPSAIDDTDGPPGRMWRHVTSAAITKIARPRWTCSKSSLRPSALPGAVLACA